MKKGLVIWDRFLPTQQYIYFKSWKIENLSTFPKFMNTKMVVLMKGGGSVVSIKYQSILPLIVGISCTLSLDYGPECKMQCIPNLCHLPTPSFFFLFIFP